jgi:hypothetical protein
MNSTIAAPSLLPHTEGAQSTALHGQAPILHFAVLTAPTHVPHRERTSSRDASGRVLVAGGGIFAGLASAELYQ